MLNKNCLKILKFINKNQSKLKTISAHTLQDAGLNIDSLDFLHEHNLIRYNSVFDYQNIVITDLGLSYIEKSKTGKIHTILNYLISSIAIIISFIALFVP